VELTVRETLKEVALSSDAIIPMVPDAPDGEAVDDASRFKDYGGRTDVSRPLVLGFRERHNWRREANALASAESR
jgi:hypothetical protein